jgi:hypothetical protein
MRNKMWIGAVALGLAGFLYAMTWAPAPVDAADGKNLKVLPRNLSKKQIKSIMKDVSKAVDKGCDECHDIENFAKDTPMKKKARQMFQMTNTINATLKKQGFKKKEVTCMTCHGGKAVPKD